MDSRLPLLILTGLSGAGLSSALKVLEDQGYRVFDNLPLAMLSALLDQPSVQGHPVALSVDARASDFSAEEVTRVIREFSRHPVRDMQLVFLTADENVIVRRFTETRRRHPLASDRSIEDGIRKEQHVTFSLRLMADLVIDTSELSVHDLRRVLSGHFGRDHRARPLALTLQSFSYRRGIPREADLVFDVRFLRNPHWDEAIRHLTGQDQPVQAYIQSDTDFDTFAAQVRGLLDTLIPRYTAEGKSYLTIAVGCTGGKHRSVFLVEHLSAWLRDKGLSPYILHRELERGGA
jgi:UPF0042 nucleotide-binding protein